MRGLDWTGQERNGWLLQGRATTRLLASSCLERVALEPLLPESSGYAAGTRLRRPHGLTASLLPSELFPPDYRALYDNSALRPETPTLSPRRPLTQASHGQRTVDNMRIFCGLTDEEDLRVSTTP